MSRVDIDYGPLAALIGTWQGDKGIDVSPEPDVPRRIRITRRSSLRRQATSPTRSAKTLAIVRYHQVVTRQSNDEVFHDQIGYWTWDPATKTIAQSVNIPRVVTVLAGGSFEGDASGSDIVLDVYAKKGDPDWGILESPFMRDSASTSAFEHRVEISGDHMRYSETTSLEIYGRKFDHTDANELTRTSA